MSRESAYYDDQSKGGGGSFGKKLSDATLVAAAVPMAAVPAMPAYMAAKEKAEKKQREADAEMKRESRGVEKPANFDAIEEAKQEAKDAADRKKISGMGYKKGGSVSSASARADGIAVKGHTKGKYL